MILILANSLDYAQGLSANLCAKTCQVLIKYHFSPQCGKTFRVPFAKIPNLWYH